VLFCFVVGGLVGWLGEREHSLGDGRDLVTDDGRSSEISRSMFAKTAKLLLAGPLSYRNDILLYKFVQVCDIFAPASRLEQTCCTCTAARQPP
jgi:hypothetical protein